MKLLSRTETPDVQETVWQLRQQIHDLTGEVAALRAQLEGRIPDATAWLQNKVWSQRVALNRLNTRVVNQRFQLRTLNQLGRGLTAEEFRAALADLENPDVRKRVEDAE